MGDFGEDEGSEGRGVGGRGTRRGVLREDCGAMGDAGTGWGGLVTGTAARARGMGVMGDGG